MKNIKDELQNIILGDGPIGSSSKLKQVQHFLRKNAHPSEGIEKQEYFKGEEEKCLIDFATQHSLFYSDEIDSVCLLVRELNSVSTNLMTLTL
ncbi:hypothetical protein [Sphingobacterium sp. UBA7625]|uniref:hypothetical protein n=1 Tax=Sphingobacterium sp. UBA7625 TaxID=1947522 RepID=UPI002579B25D|nr:hypothetical protein [Sphingobacterium sp. UBA7625]